MEKLKSAENMATQRLRKTFKYPSESDDEDAVEAGMDEQDRATLISTLSSHDTSSTHLYTQLLLILPLAPIPFYLPRLFDPSTVLPSLLAIASLLASAYTLYFLPLPPQDMEPLPDSTLASSQRKTNTKSKTKSKSGYGYKVPPWEAPVEKPGRRPVPYISAEVADSLADWIVIVNRALCGVLALFELWSGTEWSRGLMIGGGFLPGLICLVVLYARTELRIIDMDALEKLQGRGVADKGKGKAT